MRLSCLLFLTVSLPNIHLLAQGPPDLSAERPGFSTPSAPVGLGVLQLENGYTYEWARLGGAKLGALSGISPLLRCGLRSEASLENPGFQCGAAAAAIKPKPVQCRYLG
jgi:hypothetical protein